ncbi:hypothetical protein D5018_15555 [Parashewanella curva]|uniref:Uncharacterized protein n=1 Tax=Parashewanella curva TaxID=2338552 RepID=A0A3L8PTP2_9GAMM|nr:hypothetical protein D5018_15555 [Parashewanella curva]
MFFAFNFKWLFLFVALVSKVKMKLNLFNLMIYGFFNHFIDKNTEPNRIIIQVSCIFIFYDTKCPKCH